MLLRTVTLKHADTRRVRKMAGYINIVLVTLCMSATAAPPTHHRTYQQHAPAQPQQVNPLDYYLQNPEVDNFYRPAQQKQVSTGLNGESSRLETLEPDSEVELVPGVQQPQQPPQQNPVAPNLPGLLPGQRVFIVHMPVPGYSPGTIGGYQPVYIVAAAPQANAAYPGNGKNLSSGPLTPLAYFTGSNQKYPLLLSMAQVGGFKSQEGFQNALFLDPSGQSVVSPAGYGPRGLVSPQLLGSPFALQRPYNLAYQDPGLLQVNGPAQQVNAAREPIRFTNLVELQRPGNQLTYQGPAVAVQSLATNKQGQAAASAPLKQASEESKESLEQKTSFRGSVALQRNKA